MVVNHTRHKNDVVIGWSVGRPLLQKDDLEIYIYDYFAFDSVFWSLCIYIYIYIYIYMR